MQNDAPVLSLCMIVRNEESNITALLDSVATLHCELIVVDTGSTDRTVELCQSRGAKVFHWHWNDDFAAARNVSIGYASGSWILWLDADDRLSSIAVQAINELAKTPTNKGYQFLVKSPKRENDGNGAVHLQLRMFPNDPSLCFRGKVHEQIAPALLENGYPMEATDIEILHTGYADKDLVAKKVERNLRLLEMMYSGRELDELGLYHLGMTMLQRREFQRAEEIFSQCIEVVRRSPMNDFLLGTIPALLGAAAEPRVGPERALELLREHAPNDLTTWTSLQILTAAEFTANLSRDAEALSLYEKVFDPIFTRPSNLDINKPKLCGKSLKWLANYWKKENKSLAVALLRLLKSIMNNAKYARSVLPDIYFEHGLYDRACDLYGWCVAVDPSDRAAWAGLVTTLRMRGDSSAEEYMEIALQLFSHENAANKVKGMAD